MRRFMPMVGDPTGEGGRQLRINQKAHQATRNTG
jgi:hypothetical protein